MNDTIILFLALLAVLCQIFVVGVLVLRLIAVWSPGAESAFKSVKGSIGPLALPFAFAVALVTMLGSLYLSEVKHYMPCNLCWYQRICIYPLTPILGLAMIRRDRNVWPYAVVLAVIDMPISIYHYLIEWIPSLEDSSVCGTTVTCNQIWFREFHYLTPAAMAFTCAATVVTLMWLHVRQGVASTSR